MNVLHLFWCLNHMLECKIKIRRIMRANESYFCWVNCNKENWRLSVRSKDYELHEVVDKMRLCTGWIMKKGRGKKNLLMKQKAEASKTHTNKRGSYVCSRVCALIYGQQTACVHTHTDACDRLCDKYRAIMRATYAQSWVCVRVCTDSARHCFTEWEETLVSILFPLCTAFSDVCKFSELFGIAVEKRLYRVLYRIVS